VDDDRDRTLDGRSTREDLAGTGEKASTQSGSRLDDGITSDPPNRRAHAASHPRTRDAGLGPNSVTVGDDVTGGSPIRPRDFRALGLVWGSTRRSPLPLDIADHRR
jgi:hypothetical protein